MYTLMNAVPPGPNRPNVNMNLVIYFFELCSGVFLSKHYVPITYH